MNSGFQAVLAMCLLVCGLAHASEDCNEAMALSIWTASEQRLRDILGIEVASPPGFLIYQTSNDLPEHGGGVVLGYYDPGSKQISVVCSDQDASVFALNVRHESTHYYLHMAYGKVPDWLDEGLASYLEEGSLNEGEPRQHLNKKRLDEFVYLLRKSRVPPLKEVFEGRGFARPSQYYATSWALVFALLHHENSVVQLNRRNMLKELLKLSSTSQDLTHEIHQNFKQEASREDVDLEAWQTRWHRQMWSLR